MNIFGYNVNLTNSQFKFIILIIIVFVIISFLISVVFAICSYFIFKYLKMSLEENNVFFYNYNKKTQKMLHLYGNCKVTKLYLVRQPFGKLVSFLLNIFTFYKYDKLINENQDNLPYHTFMIIEIKLPNNMKKLLLLEKNNCIQLSENFFVNYLQDMKIIKIKNKKYTLNYILNTTKDRIGDKKFFNWHIFKNNCQKFMKEILITINKYNNSNKEYILRDKIFKIIYFTDFTVHFANSFFMIYNIFFKYIYDNNIFSL